MRILLLFLLASVIVTSGCVGLPDIFGRDVISIQQSVVENGVKDVVIVRDIYTIPKSPLLPDQQVILSFLIENRDSVKRTDATVDLFNAPTMRSSSNDPALDDKPCNFYSVGSALPNQRYCIPELNECGVGNPCPILPGEEKPVNIAMKTPRDTDIKNIRTQAKLDFKTTYDFDGALNYIVPAVNMEEITKRQRAGEKTSLFTTKSHGSGPMQIDVELQGAPYILNNYEAVMLFKIKNRGSGTLVKSEIESGAMEILFPPEFDVIEDKSSEKFECVIDAATGGMRCTNNGGKNMVEGAIPIYRDESRSSLMFTVKLREPLVEPFRSYQITSTIRYRYELRNSVDIVINPFNNV